MYALAGGVAAMPALIANPGHIWLSVTPVDLRRGIEGLSGLVQQSLGHNPCAGSAFVFRNTSRVAVSKYCSGMATAFGYASADYIRGILFGRSPVSLVFH